MAPRRNFALIAAGFLLVSLGCPADTRPENDAEVEAPATGPADPDAFARDAHRSAFTRALELARPMLVLDDPIGANQLGHATLRPPAIDLRSRTELRRLRNAAAVELDPIKPRHLNDEHAGVLRLLRTAMARIEHETGRDNPARFDPSWGVDAVRRYLDQLEYDLAHGRCAACGPNVAQLGGTFSFLRLELGAASPATLAAAIDDVEDIRSRLARAPKLHPDPVEALEAGVAEATTAIDQWLETSRARLRHVRRAELHEWGKTIAPAREAAQIKRMPSRLGRAELERRLGRDEALDIPVKRLFDGSILGLQQLTALAQRHKVDGYRPSTRRAAARVDRCLAAAEPIAAWVEGQSLAKAAIDCEAITRAASERISDDELLDHIVRWGVVAPTRRGHRSSATNVVGLVRGSIMPVSQGHATVSAVLGQVSEQPGLGYAMHLARTSACLATTALWIHGELGDDDELKSSLDAWCGWRKADSWIADAERRPRDALGGQALSRLADSAAAGNMDRLWWAPSGADILLKPARGPERAPRKAKIERVTASTAGE